MVHAAIARVTGHEHWELSESEAKEVTSVARDALSQYGYQVADRTATLIELVTVMGAVYGSRVLLTISENQKARQAAPSPTPASPLNGTAAPASTIGVGELVDEVPPQFRPPNDTVQ